MVRGISSIFIIISLFSKHQMALGLFQQYLQSSCQCAFLHQMSETQVRSWLTFLGEALTARGTLRSAGTRGVLCSFGSRLLPVVGASKRSQTDALCRSHPAQSGTSPPSLAQTARVGTLATGLLPHGKEDGRSRAGGGAQPRLALGARGDRDTFLTFLVSLASSSVARRSCCNLGKT